MREFFSNIFKIIIYLSFLALLILSLVNTVTSEFIISAIIAYIICWIISLFIRRHYCDLVFDIGALIVCIILLINLIYSRVIVAPDGETNETMIFLYIYWVFAIIVLYRRSIKQYREKEGLYKSYLISKGAELLHKNLESDDWEE
jgi:hypothetical protein